MRLCASLSSVSDKDRIEKTDIAEVRLDLLRTVPDIPRKEMLVTFRDEPDLSILPDNYNGYIDVGEYDISETNNTIISSFHDYEQTPSADGIINKLSGMKGDVVKVAYNVRSFSDLKNIYDASQKLNRKHILLGMGELGTVTRIRQSILNNEFTFAYVSEPTAPGQLSLEEMSYLGDDPMVVGIVGDPLEKTLSPLMHNTVMKELGIKGIYLKFEVNDLVHLEDVVKDYEIKGLNVTIPYKTEVIDHIDSISKDAEAIGAVNTIINNSGSLKGYNTDIIGIEGAMRLAGFDPAGKRALIMGSGGAARACAYILRERGCRVTVIGRNQETVRTLCNDMGCETRSNDSISILTHDLIINCTPVGMYGTGEYPINICQLTKHHTVFDMIYGVETELISRAKKVDANIVSGEDMLAMQGAASMELWSGKKDLFKKMRSVLD